MDELGPLVLQIPGVTEGKSKDAGTLRVYARGLTLVFSTSGTASMLVAAREIRSYQVNKAGSAKSMLKVTLLSDKSFKLTFPTAADRDVVRDHLARVLPSEKRDTMPPPDAPATKDAGADAAGAGAGAGAGAAERERARPQRSAREMEEIKLRAAMLAGDKELRELYQDLVGGGSLSDTEFWEHRSLAEVQQSKGATTEILSDVRPALNKANTMTFTINAAIIADIFREKPHVARAYREHVPSTMSEKEFWTTYFQAEHFKQKLDPKSKRKRLADDIFEQAKEQMEGEALEKQIEQQAVDEGLRDGRDSLLPGHGLPTDLALQPARLDRNETLVRKFHNHAVHVLPRGPPAKRQRVDELEDLEPEPTRATTALDLRERDQIIAGDAAEDAPAGGIGAVRTALADWRPVVPAGPPAYDPQRIMEVLQRVARAPNRQINTAAQGTEPGSESLQKTLKRMHLKSTELLRHFWSTYRFFGRPPPPAYIEKRRRVLESLRKLHSELQRLRHSVPLPQQSKVYAIIDPMIAPLKTAFERGAPPVGRR